MEYIKVGTISTTHGIKGELKIKGDNACFSTSFKNTLYISSTPYTKVHIKSVKQQGNQLIVGFDEFNDINQVEKFKGLFILANKEDLAPLEEDEYYIRDLIGLKVYNQDNEYKGLVKDVIEYPQSFYLMVETEKKDVLVPFIKEFVIEVSDSIIVDEIEGLF